MAKDIFVLIQYNKATNKFDIKFFPNALDAKEFQADLIQADPGQDLVFNSFIVNELKKKVSQPNMFFYKKPVILSRHPLNGLLYSGHCIDTPNFCPPGWHLPSIEEITTLISNFGDENTAAAYLKSTNVNRWLTQEPPANNNSNFSLFGSGFINNYGNFYELLESCMLRTSFVYNNRPGIFRFAYNSNFCESMQSLRNYGCSVRFLKDNDVLPANNQITDFSGNIYNCVKIGNQVWTAENHMSKFLFDGTPITFITTSEDWSMIYEISCCAYNFDNSLI